jgi:2-polyprenyl-6-methoxyphenol hydroxylase-like FAD-dependent oxidoreductase
MSRLNRIAIIGAGPAGLTAARIFQLCGLQVLLFEADASNDARDQGGSVDLGADGRLKALELAGLLEEFRVHARYDDQDTRYLDHATAQPLFERRGPSGTSEHPEIDRKALRGLLLASLSPGAVRWGHKLHRVTLDGSRHRLEFTTGPRRPSTSWSARTVRGRWSAR